MMQKPMGLRCSLSALAASGLLLAPAQAQLSADDLALAQENYAAADQDGTPGLTQTEFEAFVRANAEHDIGISRRIRRFNAFGRAFGTVDRNGDGLVMWDEFVAVSSGG
ncbi:MAG: hypothetical protein AAGA39_07575 [Pseudomonadota bacterium]